MVINGVDRKFELNVRSHREICKHLPDGDFSKIGELFAGNGAASVDAYIMLAVCLNRGYEDHKHYNDPSYVPNYLEESDFDFFSFAELAGLESELTEAFQKGMHTTVETEQAKAKKKVGVKA